MQPREARKGCLTEESVERSQFSEFPKIDARLNALTGTESLIFTATLGELEFVAVASGAQRRGERFLGTADRFDR